MKERVTPWLRDLTISALQAECVRIREVIKRCDSAPTTTVAAHWLRRLIARSEKAIARQDVGECAERLRQLRDVKVKP